MSLAASTAAWTVALPALDKLVLLSLADHADSAGRCWPSVERLSERCGMHRATVLKALKALTVAGHITVERGTGRLNHYLVHPLQPVETSRPQQPVADSDQSPTATIPVAHSDGTSRPQRPYQSLTATQTSQEPVINRSERARGREPVAHSDRSPTATGKERPEGLQRILDHVRAGFAASARR